MITKNFETVILGMIFNGCNKTITDVDGVSRTYQDTTQQPKNLQVIFDSNIITSINGTNTCGVAFISGGTEPKKDDYKTDGTIITGLNMSKVIVKSGDENSLQYEVTYTLTNTKSVAVTIDEVCMYYQVYYKSTSYAYAFLADRTRLEKPITIEAGGVGQVTYTIKLDLPS